MAVNKTETTGLSNATAPLARWYKNPGYAEALAVHVNEPIVQSAMATLVDAAQPSLVGMPPDEEKRSMHYAWLAGYRDAFRDIMKLSRVNPTGSDLPQNPDLEEWAHIGQKTKIET